MQRRELRRPATDSVEPERRSTTLVVALIVTLSLAVVCGLVAMWWAAYDRQAARVTKIRKEYEKLQHDHTLIGEHFVQQSSQLSAAVKSMQGAYQRGFVRGRKTAALPVAFRPLWPSVRAGYIVPFAVPRQLHDRPVVRQQPHGYIVRWKSVALYASDRQTLDDWTSKAWPGTARNVRAGLRTLTRIVGPYGTVYAWRERNKTYAVVAKPSSDSLAVPLVKGLG